MVDFNKSLENPPSQTRNPDASAIHASDSQNRPATELTNKVHLSKSLLVPSSQLSSQRLQDEECANLF